VCRRRVVWAHSFGGWEVQGWVTASGEGLELHQLVVESQRVSRRVQTQRTQGQLALQQPQSRGNSAVPREQELTQGRFSAQDPNTSQPRKLRSREADHTAISHLTKPRGAEVSWLLVTLGWDGEGGGCLLSPPGCPASLMCQTQYSNMEQPDAVPWELPEAQVSSHQTLLQSVSLSSASLRLVALDQRGVWSRERQQGCLFLIPRRGPHCSF
jgi:hypothetical protein